MELIPLGEKFVKKMKEYLATEPVDSTTIYSENNSMKYYQVDAHESENKVECSITVKDKILRTTETHYFELTPKLIKNAIERNYASMAELFMFYVDGNMSNEFIAEEMNKLLDSTEEEDKFIYGTTTFMCALCYMDEEEAFGKDITDVVM